MPYRTRYKKKRSYYRKSMNALSLASKALYVAKQTKSLINVEKKLIDRVTTLTPDTAGDIQSLILVGNGTNNNDRIGKSIKITDIIHRYYMGINNSATNTTVRAMLVVDRQANAGTFPLSDFLADSSAQANIISPVNINNGTRFHVLYNRIHQLSSTGNQNAKAMVYKKAQLHIKYINTGATISAISANNLVWIFISDEAVNKPTIEIYTRLRFVDN